MTASVDPLDEIASEKRHWLSFGIRLLGAMSTPSQYGLSQPDEVLAEVARLLDQTPASLLNTIQATRYVVEHAPKEIERLRHDPKVGLSHINLLSRLKDVDTDEVEALRAQVFDGRVKYLELAAKVRKLQEGVDATVAEILLRVGPPERILGRKRAKSFQWTLKQFLTARLKELTGRPKAKLLTGQKQLPIPIDHLVWDGDAPVIAIEAKAPRRAFRQSVLVEMLGTCSLVQRRVPEVWLITPRGWEAGLGKIASIADEMQQPGLRFFSFDEATAVSGISAFREIRHSDEARERVAKGDAQVRRGRHQS